MRTLGNDDVHVFVAEVGIDGEGVRVDTHGEDKHGRAARAVVETSTAAMTAVKWRRVRAPME
jgi:hypothetical protein